MDFWGQERIQERFDEIWNFGKGSQNSHVDTPMPSRKMMKPQNSFSSMSSSDPSDQYEVNLSMRFSNDKESFKLQKNFVFGEKQFHKKSKKMTKAKKNVRLDSAPKNDDENSVEF
ncbi:unnamed protein product [Oikopleura dioica]|uniref:Uncharacterized protein n=1 Tax=Oikopleura dioica TaxID=34765 RepID=E4XKF1_OIKDI|nr:unnamed protein product [Oikopleura dioica]